MDGPTDGGTDKAGCYILTVGLAAEKKIPMDTNYLMKSYTAPVIGDTDTNGPLISEDR